MVESKRSRLDRLYQVAWELSAYAFVDEHDRYDVVSVTWECWTKRPEVRLRSLVWYACKVVRGGRQFPVSTRDLDSPQGMQKPGRPRREFVEILDPCSLRIEPSDLAAFRIDFTRWRETLSERKRLMLESMIAGEETSELARKFNLTSGRISQIRRGLVEGWLEFTA